MRRRNRRLGWLGGLMAVLACLGFGLRLLDGPFFVFHGGPFRSGVLGDYADVDWASLDRHRALELELPGTGRSLLLWFSPTEGRPYISCGFGCEDGLVRRWPSRPREDARVVVRLDGRRVRARAELVSRDSSEHDRARSERRAKFGAGESPRARAEQHAHDAIVELGSGGASDAVVAPSGQLFRIVAPRSDPARP